MYPVVHEQILHYEVGDKRFEWCGKLFWGQLSQVTEGGQRSDELLEVSRVEAFVQRLDKHTNTQSAEENQTFQTCRVDKHMNITLYLSNCSGLGKIILVLVR